MKKLIALTVLLALVMTAFAGCSDNDDSKNEQTSQEIVTGSSTLEEALDCYINAYWGYESPSQEEAKKLVPADMTTFSLYYNTLQQEREYGVPKVTSVCGENYTCSITPGDQEDMTQEIEEIRSQIDTQGRDGQKLTAYRYVGVSVTFAGSTDFGRFSAQGYAYAYQYDGNWYIEFCYLPLGF